MLVQVVKTKITLKIQENSAVYCGRRLSVLNPHKDTNVSGGLIFFRSHKTLSCKKWKKDNSESKQI